ncbi:hypothetical protein [Streptomyces albidus (ex Kaewkla and Franco 2022)]|uniref:hypothetical protein n=1 Tax=Streptomyces albidus (ex Kaewkla and Franco 2022) TaxID=722709 RepID=UPI0015EF92BB|nr:hypothetical protein [Streptomyces albidus (ex Kaewkla and Franco 2022)]
MRLGRWSVLRRAAIAVACASVMALGGLPATMQASAKPKPLDPGLPCFEYFELLEDAAGLVDLPEGDASRAKSQWDTYEYVNEGKKWDGLQAPSAAEEARIGALEKKPPKSKPTDRIYWTWIRAKENDSKNWSRWDHWRDARFIRNSGNDPRGKAFEKKVIKDHGLTSKDWICQKEVIFEDPDTGIKHRRQLDAYNPKTGKILEVKGNGELTETQKPKDRAWAKDPKWRGTSWKYVFAEPQTKGSGNFIEEQRKTAQTNGRQVTEYNYRSDKVEKAPSGGVRYKSTNMQPPGKSGTTGGGASDLIRESRPNPKEMKEFLDRKNAADPKRLSPRGPGGVDFTTLELRYVGKPQKGKGLDYGFSAKQDPTGQSGWGGKAKSQLISDAFFTWLALTPEKFWVNLNPDQPDKIMDSQFGKTDAGRVLLEADLGLKKDFAAAINPTKRPEADQYWKSLPRNDKGQPCWFQVRNWIEPKEAVVREENGGIHILDTPLSVKAEYLKIDNMPGDPYLCDFDEAEKEATERRMNRLIMPEVEKQVNTSPRYADLRRVYTARVAAEFIRQQDAKNPTDYHKIINSNDVSAWPLRAPNQDWTREKPYQAYLDSLKNGEESWEHDAGGGPYTYSVGGVDFSKQPKRNMNKVRFSAEHRHLPKQTRTSVQTLTDNTKDREQNLLLLGGNTVNTDTGGGGDDGGGGGDEPDPTPTPTPTPTDKPTGGPTSPAPDPSSPGGGDKPKPPAKDPHGDLADTGSDIPVGLIASVAAALAAAGATLVWWTRRRRQGAAQ